MMEICQIGFFVKECSHVNTVSSGVQSWCSDVLSTTDVCSRMFAAKGGGSVCYSRLTFVRWDAARHTARETPLTYLTSSLLV